MKSIALAVALLASATVLAVSPDARAASDASIERAFPVSADHLGYTRDDVSAFMKKLGFELSDAEPLEEGGFNSIGKAKTAVAQVLGAKAKVRMISINVFASKDDQNENMLNMMRIGALLEKASPGWDDKMKWFGAVIDAGGGETTRGGRKIKVTVVREMGLIGVTVTPA